MSTLLSKDFVPLYTALAWIIFWGVLLIISRKHLFAAFAEINTRIREGAALTLGPVKLGEPPKNFRDTPSGAAAVSNTPDPGTIPAELTQELITQ